MSRAQNVTAEVMVQALVRAKFSMPATTHSTLEQLRDQAARLCRTALSRSFLIEDGSEASGWVDEKDAFIVEVKLRLEETDE